MGQIKELFERSRRISREGLSPEERRGLEAGISPFGGVLPGESLFIPFLRQQQEAFAQKAPLREAGIQAVLAGLQQPAEGIFQTSAQRGKPAGFLGTRGVDVGPPPPAQREEIASGRGVRGGGMFQGIPFAPGQRANINRTLGRIASRRDRRIPAR